MKNPQDVTPAEYEFGGESAGAEQEQGESGKWRSWLSLSSGKL